MARQNRETHPTPTISLDGDLVGHVISNARWATPPNGQGHVIRGFIVNSLAILSGENHILEENVFNGGVVLTHANGIELQENVFNGTRDPVSNVTRFGLEIGSGATENRIAENRFGNFGGNTPTLKDVPFFALSVVGDAHSNVIEDNKFDHFYYGAILVNHAGFRPNSVCDLEEDFAGNEFYGNQIDNQFKFANEFTVGFTYQCGRNDTVGSTEGKKSNSITGTSTAVHVRQGSGIEIRGNKIYQNQSAIRLGYDTPSNDLHDLDDGANLLQNSPVITMHRLGVQTKVSGTLRSTPNATFEIDFYVTDTTGATAFGHGVQAETHLETISVTTDQDGIARLDLLVQTRTGTNSVITATATDANGNTSPLSQPASDFRFGDEEVRTPVILLPGIFGSHGKDLKSWLVQRGPHIDTLELDPFKGYYNNITQTLQNAGYVLNRDLFLAPYDWRLPTAPDDGRADGIIHRSAEQLSDGSFEYGVDYLGYVLKSVADIWYGKHGEPLTSVHVIAHSMGGLVARAYIQSSGYGQRIGGSDVSLPVVSQFTMIGVPNQGASKVFNPLHDNWKSDLIYQIFISKFGAHAWWHVQQGGSIAGPDRTITADSATTKAEFIRMYAAGMKDLLPTYSGSGIPVNSGLRNVLLEDLNTNLSFVTLVPHVSSHIGTGEETYSSVRARIGPSRSFLGVPLTQDVFSMTDKALGSFVSPSERWYEDVYGFDGDGTVPIESSSGFPFDVAKWIDEHAYPFTDHNELLSNGSVQKRILQSLVKYDSNTAISTEGNSDLGRIGSTLRQIWIEGAKSLIFDKDGHSIGVDASGYASVNVGPAAGVVHIEAGANLQASGSILSHDFKFELDSAVVIGTGKPFRIELTGFVDGKESYYHYEGFLEEGQELRLTADDFSRVPPSGDDRADVALVRPGAGANVRLHDSRTEPQPSGSHLNVEDIAVDPDLVEQVLVVGSDQDEQLDLSLLSHAHQSQVAWSAGLGTDELVVSGESVSGLGDISAEGLEQITVLGHSPKFEIALADIERLNAHDKTLRLAFHGTSQLKTDRPWSYASSTVSDDRLTHHFVAENMTLELQSSAPMQNPINRFDVNHDGNASVLDALLVINRISRGGDVSANTTAEFKDFWDASGDNTLTSLDALLVINSLANSRGEAEDAVQPNDRISARPMAAYDQAKQESSRDQFFADYNSARQNILF